MFPRRAWAWAILAGWIGGLAAQGGGGDRFPVEIESQVGETKVKMTLTGTAIRSRGRFRVYAMASYLQAGVKVGGAEELVAATCAKQFHLVMLRKVSGPQMADALVTAIREHHPAPAFDKEIKALADYLRGVSARPGDQVWISNIPKVGLHCRRGNQEVLIRNADFSRAFWDIYLGKNSVSEDIKRGLVSRLGNQK